MCDTEADALRYVERRSVADSSGIAYSGRSQLYKILSPDGEIDKKDDFAITRIATEITDRIIDLTPSTAPNETAEALALFLPRNRAAWAAGALSGLKVEVYQHSTVTRDGLTM